MSCQESANENCLVVRSHLVVPGSDLPRGVDPALRAQMCLDDIRARHADADRLIITGDLIQLRHIGA